MGPETRNCQNCKKTFTIEPDDFGFYEKMKVPPPTFCPGCRRQRRLAWRNEMTLYSRPCDFCGKSTVSIYSPDSGLTVYCIKCWWSDNWDPMRYGQEYDFSRPFFEQFRELQQKVPIIALANDDGIAGGSVNCAYNQDFARAKDCYMVFSAWKLQDSMYSNYVLDGRGMVDCMGVWDECDSVYDAVYAERCYSCRNVYYSVALTNCSFCLDCRDSSDCFMCTGLRHKRYCFKNKQYSKEEYETILQSYKLDTYSGAERAREEFKELLYVKPRRFANHRNSVNSTGEYLSNCKNVHNCFVIQRGEDCRYIESSDTPKDSYDLTNSGELSLGYEGVTIDNTYNGAFGIFAWKNHDFYYLDGCHSCENLFGCAGLKKARYCILNKQYTEEEYGKLAPRIIEHMNKMPYVDKNGVEYRFGEFFPSELSYFGYNESVAQDHFQLSREDAKNRHFNWRENLPFTTNRETMSLSDMPDSIKDIDDSVLEQVFACGECKRNYRLTPQELQFYRKFNIPLPRRCFFCRRLLRLEIRNPLKLYHRTCQCAGHKSSNGIYQNTVEHQHGDKPCPNEFETSYAPDRPEIVYCESCYNSEIV